MKRARAAVRKALRGHIGSEIPRCERAVRRNPEGAQARDEIGWTPGGDARRLELAIEEEGRLGLSSAPKLVSDKAGTCGHASGTDTLDASACDGSAPRRELHEFNLRHCAGRIERDADAMPGHLGEDGPSRHDYVSAGRDEQHDFAVAQTKAEMAAAPGLLHRHETLRAGEAFQTSHIDDEVDDPLSGSRGAGA